LRSGWGGTGLSIDINSCGRAPHPNPLSV